MDKISTYIFVHNQDIILKNDKTGKFNNLPDKKYVFLGKKEIDKIDSRDDVIVARNLKHNIEQYPKFCSFTGWYALWKNNLIQSEYVHLFEYDIKIKDKFYSEVEKAIIQNPEFIGYVPLPVEFSFINDGQYLCNIFNLIKKKYNTDAELLLKDICQNRKHLEWSSTSNSTFLTNTFNQYMEWFGGIMYEIGEDKMCGHAHERSISMFYMLFNKKIVITKYLITHYFLNSHSIAI